MLYNVSVHFHRDFIEVKDNHIEIGIMSKPQKGEANEEIIKKIAKYFHVSRSNVRLVSGQKSRIKVVQVTR
ncbi:MAG: DUF167 domain-containing protein [Thaumarchaeota archaeon]|nr:DUF167 domain-containing protein [Nitrososphaerota archaeon]